MKFTLAMAEVYLEILHNEDEPRATIQINPIALFPSRNNADNAKRRTLRRMIDVGFGVVYHKDNYGELFDFDAASLEKAWSDFDKQYFAKNQRSFREDWRHY